MKTFKRGDVCVALVDSPNCAHSVREGDLVVIVCQTGWFASAYFYEWREGDMDKIDTVISDPSPRGVLKAGETKYFEKIGRL